MYDFGTIGCPNSVSHPGQLCLECEQREMDLDELEESDENNSCI